MSNLSCFLGTVLPNVRAEDLPARGEDDVSSGMMSLELLSPLSVDGDVGLLALVELNISFEWSVEGVQDDLSYLDGIYNLVLAGASLDFDDSGVVLLPSRGWVDC